MKKLLHTFQKLKAKWEGRDKGRLHGLTDQFVYGTQTWTMK